MRALSIGEVARRAGVRPSALRYYEAAGILPAPARAGGRRWYDEAAIQRIDMLKFAQQAGFTLKEIKVLFDAIGTETPLSARWQTLARKKLQELDVMAARIAQMRQMLELGLKCGCIRIEDCSVFRALSRPQQRSRARVSRKRAC
ncbi:MAG TPA: MerR family transcriptional regulator [Steroidobacteraceae bacterium]|jgi:MerR family redox-sensitive transcriptional activator SoxR